MTILTQTRTTRRTPNARTFEGRQRIHAIKRTLGYSESEYRTVLYGITGSRYARDLNDSQLTHVVAVLSEFALERERAQAPKVETDQERYEREQDELIQMLAGF
jgi:adenylylsulfate kinase-like enzyme